MSCIYLFYNEYNIYLEEATSLSKIDPNLEWTRPVHKCCATEGSDPMDLVLDSGLLVRCDAFQLLGTVACLFLVSILMDLLSENWMFLFLKVCFGDELFEVSELTK